jgi:hypothetical protein
MLYNAYNYDAIDSNDNSKFERACNQSSSLAEAFCPEQLSPLRNFFILDTELGFIHFAYLKIENRV